MLPADRRILLAIALSAVGIVASAGCEILFWTSIDPHGLPCRTPTAENPQVCLAGYTCIEGTCRKAAALSEGDPCDADSECGVVGGEQMVCRNHFEANTCEANDYDINCTVGRALGLANPGRVCQRVCNPLENPYGTCALGYACWVDEEGGSALGGYCQPGVCATDADCGSGAWCAFRDENPDPTDTFRGGRCFRACDPLQCNPASGCVGCPTEDVDGDGLADIMGCEPEPSAFNNLSRMACQVSGAAPARAVCGPNDICQPGNMCASADGNGTETCRPYCLRSAATCNAGEGCLALPGAEGEAYGVCF